MMGSKKRGHGGHGIVHFLVVIVGNFQQHFRQGAGLLAHVHHADHHGRENAGSLQRRGDGFTFLHAFMHAGDGIADDDVAGGFP